MRAGLKRSVFIMSDIRTVSALMVVTLSYAEPLQDQRAGGNVESVKITMVVTCRRLRSGMAYFNAAIQPQQSAIHGCKPAQRTVKRSLNGSSGLNAALPVSSCDKITANLDLP